MSEIRREVVYRVAGEVAVALLGREHVFAAAVSKEQREELIDNVVEEASVIALTLRDVIEDKILDVSEKKDAEK